MESRKHQEFEYLSSMVHDLKINVDKLFKAVYQQELHLDSLEQHSLSNCLILHGCNADFKKMSNEQVEDWVLNVLNKNLSLPCEINEYEIDICHPLPTNKKKNPIIIKFVRRSIRNLVFNQKKNLKHMRDHRLAINESLTKRRLKLVDKAWKVFRFENVCTMKGEVFVEFKGQKFHVNDFPDIERIRFSDNTSYEDY